MRVTNAQKDAAVRKINEFGYKIIRGEELTDAERAQIVENEDIKDRWFDQRFAKRGKK